MEQVLLPSGSLVRSLGGWLFLETASQSQSTRRLLENGVVQKWGYQNRRWDSIDRPRVQSMRGIM